MINLQKELVKLIKDHPSPVILRSMKNKKCTCWRAASNTPDLACPNCKGAGYLYRESLQKIYMSIITLPRVAHEQDFNYGKSYSNMMTIYFHIENDKLPDVEIDDLIFEIETTTNGIIKNPITRKRKWIVTEAYTPLLDNGKPQFIKVLAKPINA